MKNLLKFLLIFTAGVMTTLAVKIQLADRNAPVVDLSPVAAAEQADSLESATDSRQNAITQAIAKVSPAVVGINVTRLQAFHNRFMDDPFYEFFFGRRPHTHKVQSAGSGVIFTADGLVLTNQHVIGDADEIMITLPGGEQRKATIVGEDYKTDIAVLQIKGKDFSYAPIGDSDDLIIGEWAIAIGNPFGLFDVSAKPTVTVGVISATDQDFGLQSSDRLYEDMIQTDAAINSGNSGGPLVNCNGQLIGINTFIFSGSSASGTNIGLGFAIPINPVTEILDELLEKGRVDRSYWTGIQYDEVTDAVAHYLRLNSTDGVIITDIQKNSPAEKAGLQPIDVILELNGTPIKSGSDLLTIIKEQDLKQGDILDLKIFRESQIYSVKVELAAYPKNVR